MTAGAGSLVIASALIAPATLQAAVNPQPAKSVPDRVEAIQSQIAGSGADLGSAETMKDWRNWRNWHNWRNWRNHPVWSNWSNWNNWHNWNNHNWHNWGDWNNHLRN